MSNTTLSAEIVMSVPEARGKLMYLKLRQYTPGSIRFAGNAVTSLHDPPPQPVGPSAVAARGHKAARKKMRRRQRPTLSPVSVARLVFGSATDSLESFFLSVISP